jgi:hypothetical protein
VTRVHIGLKLYILLELSFFELEGNVILSYYDVLRCVFIVNHHHTCPHFHASRIIGSTVLISSHTVSARFWAFSHGKPLVLEGSLQLLHVFDTYSFSAFLAMQPHLHLPIPIGVTMIKVALFFGTIIAYFSYFRRYVVLHT